jgi:prepilin signal peptidase PulO-like enzyme (type II secretory pathway)
MIFRNTAGSSELAVLCYNGFMIAVVLFIFGLVIGSFLNVVILRYDGDHFILDPRIIGGRSHCNSCGKTLRWFELVPLASFVAQRGRCRTCRTKLSFQYPVVELISGLIFVFVPWRLGVSSSAGPLPWVVAGLWIAAFLVLLVLSVIDVRMGILPDELNIALGSVGVALGILLAVSFPGGGSLLGRFGDLFTVGNVWVGRMIGAVAGFVFFEFLVVITKGKGIGMGDVKLALALGLLFGWPDIAAVAGCAFIFGAALGVILILARRKTMTGALPFGPFLATGAAFIFLFGAPLVEAYLHTIGI